tara:strand:- start:406 stop:750 length:345 start_codon:yes stop_codon:yes gene_type:complete
MNINSMFFCVESSEETRNAQIYSFRTQAEAIRFFQKNLSGLRLVDFHEVLMDEWIVVDKKPDQQELADMITPLAIEQVNLIAPGNHAGSFGYWIEPNVQVFAPVFEVEEEELST